VGTGGFVVEWVELVVVPARFDGTFCPEMRLCSMREFKADCSSDCAPLPVPVSDVVRLLLADMPPVPAPIVAALLDVPLGLADGRFWPEMRLCSMREFSACCSRDCAPLPVPVSDVIKLPVVEALVVPVPVALVLLEAVPARADGRFCPEMRLCSMREFRACCSSDCAPLPVPVSDVIKLPVVEVLVVPVPVALLLLEVVPGRADGRFRPVMRLSSIREFRACCSSD